VGRRGGWRDYCIVTAPERSGFGDVRGSSGVGFAAGVRGREAMGRRMCEAEGATRASAQDVGEVVDVVGVVGG